jgi:hypothetical protein
MRGAPIRHSSLQLHKQIFDSFAGQPCHGGDFVAKLFSTPMEFEPTSIKIEKVKIPSPLCPPKLFSPVWSHLTFTVSDENDVPTFEA